MADFYDYSAENECLRHEKMLAVIREKIVQSDGLISFATFMDLALYHSEFGYYQHLELGKAGDFITAPEISPLFARCFAEQIQQFFRQTGWKSILEIGAGSGRFAIDALLHLQRKDALPSPYFIYERCENLRLKQQAYLQKVIPDLYAHVQWLTELPPKFSGIVIANEVLDALPVHCFKVTPDGVQEKGVTWNDALEWQLSAQITPNFLEYARKIVNTYNLDANYESEINLNLKPFIKNLIDCIDQGVILFSDYGYGQREYYHPERANGTLTCFYKHQRSQNPFTLLGLKDISAHVDFTQVAECAIDEGCQLLGFTSQAGFLLGCGLTELIAAAEQDLSIAECYQLHQAIKVLTFPTEMGDRVKVMALSKNLNDDEAIQLRGFSMVDQRREL